MPAPQRNVHIAHSRSAFKLGESTTNATKMTLTDEEIRDAFKVLGLSPDKKRHDVRSRLGLLKVTKGTRFSYKILEDKNAGPAQEK